jgi:hypothetical protein
MENTNLPAATGPQLPAKSRIESYDISRSDETLALATDLAKFIKENKLSMNIQGKEYILVEGYSYAGSRLGILPIIESLTNLSEEKVIKYQCQVSLLNLRTGQKVGSGFAVCRNDEPGKKYFQEFAIASMAQTRAIGKAYRNILAWIIKAAGYEPCSAEEMDSVHTGAEVVEDQRRKGKTKEELAKSAADPNKVHETGDGATTKQKAEILLLSNNEVITKEEKEKIILNINKYTREKADKRIEWLNREIAARREVLAAEGRDQA